MNTNFDDLKGKVCVITGGAGVIGSAISTGLSHAGVRMAILDIHEELAVQTAVQIQASSGTPAAGFKADVLDRDSLMEAKKQIQAHFGRIDFLINGAGGNSPKATTQVETMTKDSFKDLEKTFYGLDLNGFQWVYDLNFKGTLLPVMVLTTDMLEAGKGSILNISSMNSFRPLTKIPAYSAAKASVNNFTQWLAVHLAQTGIRVNAIAPGFFLTHQNRFLLEDEKTGQPTARGRKVMASTPMAKYGDPSDLVGAVLYFLSDLSSFVTGVILPVDGGFSAYGGV